jgi:hypothetical protein
MESQVESKIYKPAGFRFAGRYVERLAISLGGDDGAASEAVAAVGTKPLFIESGSPWEKRILRIHQWKLRTNV